MQGARTSFNVRCSYETESNEEIINTYLRETNTGHYQCVCQLIGRIRFAELHDIQGDVTAMCRIRGSHCPSIITI